MAYEEIEFDLKIFECNNCTYNYHIIQNEYGTKILFINYNNNTISEYRLNNIENVSYIKEYSLFGKKIT